jgi:hypothetical protein
VGGWVGAGVPEEEEESGRIEVGRRMNRDNLKRMRVSLAGRLRFTIDELRVEAAACRRELIYHVYANTRDFARASTNPLLTIHGQSVQVCMPNALSGRAHESELIFYEKRAIGEKSRGEEK